MKYLGCWIVAAAAVGTAAAEFPTKVAKPPALCGIPGFHEYRVPVDRSPTLSAQSTPPVTLQEVAAAPGTVTAVPVGAKLRYFQLKTRGLAVDHCSVTRVAVTLREDGTYTVSFRADQHPLLAGGIGDPALPDEMAFRPLRTRETNHLKRNEFTVRVRLLGTPGGETLPPAGLGPAALVPLPLKPFWVERGEPVNFFKTEKSPAVGEYFPFIAGVEVDFSYR